MKVLQNLVKSWRSELGRVFPCLAGKAESKPRRNPWPKCPCCFHRVPSLCDTAETGAQPCGNGLTCGCCTGPHKAPKQQDGGKFQTTVQKV